jgi:hypothetical protein
MKKISGSKLVNGKTYYLKYDGIAFGSTGKSIYGKGKFIEYTNSENKDVLHAKFENLESVNIKTLEPDGEDFCFKKNDKSNSRIIYVHVDDEWSDSYYFFQPNKSRSRSGSSSSLGGTKSKKTASKRLHKQVKSVKHH